MELCERRHRVAELLKIQDNVKDALKFVCSDGYTHIKEVLMSL